MTQLIPLSLPISRRVGQLSRLGSLEYPADLATWAHIKSYELAD
jgi:hypothetical protein